VKSRVHSAVLRLTEAWNKRFPGDEVSGSTPAALPVSDEP
jgi:hypothetical protein